MLHDQIYNSIRNIFTLENELDSSIDILNKSKIKLVKYSKETRELLPKGFDPIHENKKGHSSFTNFMMKMAEFPAVGFYFDDTVKYDLEMATTGYEFLKSGFLNMPFDTVFFSAPNYFDIGVGIALWSKYIKETDTIMFFETMGENLIEEKKNNFYELNLKDSICYSRDANINGWPKIKKIEENEDIFKKIIQALCHFLLLLNHPIYEKVINEIDESINIKRLKKGKQILSKYIYINMKRDFKERLLAIGGYSVRTHWRRGHVRRLNDGRIIPVQPCIVNFDGEIIPDKKTYVIKKC